MMALESLNLAWMSPDWLLGHFGTGFIWVSLAIIVIECGLFFPFLPGDTLLFAIGIFAAGDRLDLGVAVLVLLFSAAAILGNLIGYELGRALGPGLYERDGRILKRAYLDQTHVFFESHGNKALVIGRFVPAVRTFITPIAGIVRISRRRFLLWSTMGAALWVPSITLLGYFLGRRIPWLGDNIDYVMLALLAVMIVPVVYEYRRRRRNQLG